MPLKSFVSLVIFCFSMFLFQGQEDQKVALQNTYSTYFGLERENIYVHLNKSLFIPEEPIWFKAYIYNKETNKPAVNSTNIFISLYDAKGKEIENKLFFAQNGVVSGTLDLNISVKPGSYYLRAYTNWMNNFKEDESFVSLPITVLDPSEATSNSNLNNASKHDLQFLPEGGFAINDTENTIGLKLIDQNGQGMEIFGEIFDDSGVKIKDFKTNTLGFGKFNLTYASNKNYYAIYKIDNTEYRLDLPKGKEEGFTVSIDNYTNPSLTYVNLKTNQLTLENNIGKTFYLVINQNSKVSVVDLPISVLKTQNTVPVHCSGNT